MLSPPGPCKPFPVSIKLEAGPGTDPGTGSVFPNSTSSTQVSASVSKAFPTKTPAGKRTMKMVGNLVLWIVVPALLLSIILLTIRTHDLEKEDCQEDTPVNCPLDCSQGYKEVRCPAVCPKNPFRGFSCRRNTTKYWVPFLRIKLLYIDALLYVYVIILFVYVCETEGYPEEYIPRTGTGAIYWMAKERRQEKERKQKERDGMEPNGEVPSIGNIPSMC